MPTDHETLLETLKYGLLPVEQAKARYRRVVAEREELATEKVAYDAYVDACMQLHGYVQGMVNVAEGRPAHQDE
ncbi:hypothetical protein ALP80_200115 [Pseudomonas savastanoi pv. fraxini]|uniref:hypothetical protein n=1 Tax=Pseudomonas savastanoi TaxID=29438 RepID=UPI000EFFAAB0|nr:hypothetical protein [Pseudomonas savastanoi]RMR70285.1 hypothetical protein ALP80_200115 [Pseudomonas savastanoi pv. fraxini]